ncbi:hypothetical protein GCM10028793_54830 [Nocardiopsis oceani]
MSPAKTCPPVPAPLRVSPGSDPVPWPARWSPTGLTRLPGLPGAASGRPPQAGPGTKPAHVFLAPTLKCGHVEDGDVIDRIAGPDLAALNRQAVHQTLPAGHS